MQNHKTLKGFYQVKKETYNKAIEEGTTDGNLYFVRTFDENGLHVTSEIYLGDRLYGETCNSDVEGNDVEIHNTSTEYLSHFTQTLLNGGEITLEEDIVLTNAYASVKSDTIINLNGRSIVAKERNASDGTSSIVFVVYNGATLTINGDGNIISEASEKSIAVWAYGGNVVINGGTYYNNLSGSDLIYASKPCSIIINDGTFIAAYNEGTEPATKNTRSAINCLDSVADQCTILVKGGKFLEFNPADNLSEGENTSYLAEGCEVTQEGKYYIVNNTSSQSEYIEEYNQTINNGGEIELEENILNTETII